MTITTREAEALVCALKDLVETAWKESYASAYPQGAIEFLSIEAKFKSYANYPISSDCFSEAEAVDLLRRLEARAEGV